MRESGPLTDPRVLEAAVALRREEPARTGAQIAAILAELHGQGAPSARTVQRHLARAGLRRGLAAGEARGLGRFEADRPNEIWVADCLHGPVVALERGGSARRKAICFAIVDDHSRLVVGARFEAAETELRLERTLRAALEARGLPSVLYVDNGAPFASAQLERISACLGIRLIHSKPGRPEGRGKVERFFRTLRGQFLVEAQRRADLSLPDLNRMLGAWRERVYSRRVHSETREAPIERFTSGPPARFASAGELHDAFLWAEKRVVSRSATVSLHGSSFEVDPVLRGRTVELVYDPYAMGSVEVRHSGRSFGEALAQTIARHVHPRAEADLALEPPSPSGIDYLAMIETAHERELARKISYREIREAEDGNENGEAEGSR